MNIQGAKSLVDLMIANQLLTPLDGEVIKTLLNHSLSVYDRRRRKAKTKSANTPKEQLTDEVYSSSEAEVSSQPAQPALQDVASATHQEFILVEEDQE